MSREVYLQNKRINTSIFLAFSEFRRGFFCSTQIAPDLSRNVCHVTGAFWNLLTLSQCGKSPTMTSRPKKSRMQTHAIVFSKCCFFTWRQEFCSESGQMHFWPFLGHNRSLLLLLLSNFRVVAQTQSRVVCKTTQSNNNWNLMESQVGHAIFG